MGAAHDVSLRDEQPPEPPPQQFNARLPPRVIEYVRREAVGARTQASVVTDALDLDRHLSERLSGHKARLKAFAESRGLSLSDDLPQVVADLVLVALDCLDKKSKK